MLREKINKIIMEYREIVDKLDEDLKQLAKNKMYSELAMSIKRQEMIEAFNVKQQRLKDEVLGLIRAEKKKLEDQLQPKDHGPDYDIKLSNALKILELATSNMSDGEIYKVIQPFKEDYPTMASLRRVLQNYGKEGIITPDMLENQKRFALEEIERVTLQSFIQEQSQSGSNIVNLSVALQYFGSALDDLKA
jgi:hypothetical protein